jgi:hypothetical protein
MDEAFLTCIGNGFMRFPRAGINCCEPFGESLRPQELGRNNERTFAVHVTLALVQFDSS